MQMNWCSQFFTCNCFLVKCAHLFFKEPFICLCIPKIFLTKTFTICKLKVGCYAKQLSHCSMTAPRRNTQVARQRRGVDDLVQQPANYYTNYTCSKTLLCLPYLLLLDCCQGPPLHSSHSHKTHSPFSKHLAPCISTYHL